MTTAQRALAARRRLSDRPGERSWLSGARLRLALAVAGLAGLVAWGALSQIGADPSTDAEASRAARETPRLDGRGKWIGYTSEWRSRPPILRDAGRAPDR